MEDILDDSSEFDDGNLLAEMGVEDLLEGHKGTLSQFFFGYPMILIQKQRKQILIASTLAIYSWRIVFSVCCRGLHLILNEDERVS